MTDHTLMALLTRLEQAESRLALLERGPGLTPGFLAYNSAPDNDQTGNGAAPTIDCDTEVFDTGGDFATDTFTAPVTGKYLLTAAVRVTGMSSAMTEGNIRIVTSNRTYYSDYVAPYAAGGGGAYTFQITAVADMDAGDTAYVRVIISNGAGDTADIYGGAAPFTYFAGAQVG